MSRDEAVLEPVGRVWTDPRLLLWAAVSVVASPLLILAKLRRHYVRKFEWEFDLRRWRVPLLSPEVPRAEIVFVGAGAGELLMIDRVAAALRERRPETSIGICLRNLDTLAELRAKRPEQRLSVWPFDFLVPVARWVGQERPRVVVFVDRFRFPTFAGGAARGGARLALINGRSRRRKGLVYGLFAPFYRWQFGGFRLMAMQSEANVRAACDFAAPVCQVLDVGSLKADLRPRALPAAQLDSLREWLASGGTPVVAVGSTTQPEEEALALDAYLRTRAEFPCRLLFAPRDLRRVDQTLALLEERGLRVGRRSLGEPPAEVCLLDTFGELASAYGFARAAYVGGFRGKGGGHNVLEPLEHGVPVAYGPTRGLFEVEQRLAEDAGAGFAVADADALAAFWLRFLRDDADRAAVGARARAMLEVHRGAVERTVEALLGLL